MTLPTGKARMSKRGFTLLELVLVTALILVFAALAVPRLQGTYQNLELRNRMLTLRKVIELTQHRAIVTREAIRMRIDSVTGALELAKAGENGDFAPLADRFAGKLILEEPWHLAIEPQEIFFYPDGTSDSAIVTLQYRDAGYRMKLQASGNRIDVEDLSQEF